MSATTMIDRAPVLEEHATAHAVNALVADAAMQARLLSSISARANAARRAALAAAEVSGAIASRSMRSMALAPRALMRPGANHF